MIGIEGSRARARRATRWVKSGLSIITRISGEAAATAITDIANEGDKRIQAVRQRLKKAGHTHNTDEVTKEDFMFVNSKEKKLLLDLARKVARLGANASTDDIRGVHDELTDLFSKTIADE